jgi:hypothetical protein
VGTVQNFDRAEPLLYHTSSGVPAENVVCIQSRRVFVCIRFVIGPTDPGAPVVFQLVFADINLGYGIIGIVSGIPIGPVVRFHADPIQAVSTDSVRRHRSRAAHDQEAAR